MKATKWRNWWTLKSREKGESWNPKWPPRKGISAVNEELKNKWYSPATKQDIEANYMAMLQLEEHELKAMIDDKTRPMLIRILAKNMLGWKGFEIIEKMLDRWIGKATQTNEHTWKDWWPILIKDFEV